MPIAKELALKILWVLAVGGTAVGGGVALKNLSSKKTESENNASEEQRRSENNHETQGDNTPGQDTPDTSTHTEEAPVASKILEELGLECGKDNYCSLVEGKRLSVKQENNKSGTLTSLTFDGIEHENEVKEGKIRFLGSEGEDEKKITFTIEDGIIWPTWEGKDSKITILEEFETYGVEEETVAEGKKKYHFKRKTKAQDEMAKLLGLSGSDCKLPTGGDKSKSTTCTLDLEKLKAINFEGKNGDPTLGESETVTLTITKLNTNDDWDNYFKYPYGYQFVLSGDKEVKIPTSSEEMVKKAKDALGFKIKVTPETGWPKTLSLEKVSQAERLTGSLGFTDCKEEGGAKTCIFPKTINVYKDDKNSIKGGSITDFDVQTITYEEDVEGYEGGIKFMLSRDISINPGTIKGTFSKIESGDYEAKQQTIDSQTLWYLTKKT